MSRRARLLGLFLLSLTAVPVHSAESAPGQRQLKTYPLHGNPNSADFSIDEKLVVTECTIEEDPQPQVRKFSEVVQIWDFREDRLIRELSLQSAEVQAFASGQFRDPVSGQRFVRFSADGSLVIAYVNHLLHVLRAGDLTEVRQISTPGPTDIVRQTHSKRFGEHTLVDKVVLQNLEVSPAATVAALLWTRDMLHSRVEIFDFSSGQQIGAWDAPQGWSPGKRGFTWHPSGKLLLLAKANNIRCGSPLNTPDVFAFKVPSGEAQFKLGTGLLLGDIAVTDDNRVFAVDNNCMTVLKDHHPKMRVFDLGTGKHLRDIRGRATGVRYAVATSRTGEKVVAWTGKLKVNFDWSDMVAHDARVDSTFTTWNSRNYTEIATSQDIPGLDPSTLRISPNGAYLLSCGKAAYVFELP